MQIFVISHKSPDLDSSIAAISYAYLKNQIDNDNEYIPACAGKLNKETEYVLKKFNLDKPRILSNIANKNVILVDHNESSQIQDGWKQTNIIEVIDHHKINFELDSPIQFETRDWGSTCSIIQSKFKEHNIEIPKNTSRAMLAAILVDTVITKSPTCTKIDKEIINELAKVNKINWKKFGLEIFKVRSSVSKYSAVDIIKNDFKDFNFGGNKFGIGQIETVDLSELKPREEELINEMKKIKKEQNYHSIILFLTDIINEGSRFLVVSDNNGKIENALEKKLENNKVYLKGVMSRKKQVVPMLMKAF